MASTSQTDAASAPSRRAFCTGALSSSALLLTPSGLLRATSLAAQTQPLASPSETPSRPDVAAIDHLRILIAADHYLNQPPTPLTSLPCPRSPGTPHDFYSEADSPAGLTSRSAASQTFTAHRDAIFTLGLAVPALTAAHLLTGNQRYAEQAVLWLRAWFIDPKTSMTPSLNFGQISADEPARGRPEGILETLPLVEIAQAIPFLAASPALTPPDRTALNTWFASYLRWLTQPEDSGPRLPALARDRKDHHATSWLLQTAVYSILTAPASTAPPAESAAMDALRHRYKSVTLRAQIASDGTFPHELISSAPFRDSLFNLDLMAALCHLLSTRFESLWDYQLEDGPGMRSAIAYHFPFIANRALWPFRADAAHFNQLPARRVSLLLAARAYKRPEYAALWKSLSPDPTESDILCTLPIHQPLLWVRQPPLAL